ncbi:MAG: hypothetical protein QXL01_06625 [Thermoplasmatales archaeon]
MRCYNTEAADRWASEQDDIEAMQERRIERLFDMIDDGDKTVLEFLSDYFIDAICDDSAEGKREALERIFVRAYLADPLDNDCQAILSIEKLDDLLGSELDD